MKLSLIIFLHFLFILQVCGQQPVNLTFQSDTMTVPGTGKVLEGEYLETTLKNLSEVRLFKTTDNHYYIRFIITTNFYFDKIDVLEIRSGSKSYYAKQTRQFKINKTRGLYLVEIYQNYISTLKDDGITGLMFSGAETDFTRTDASQIKKIATVFYDSLAKK